MIIRKTILIFIIPAILLSLLVQSCTREPQEETLATILEREIPRLMEAANVPGISMAVVQDGQIFWKKTFGVRSRDTNEPVDEDTMFEAASLTKTVTAYAAMRLVERDELDLDRPLFEYHPNNEYPQLAKDERYKKITARLVLTHTTGLPNWGGQFIHEPGKQYAYSGEGYTDQSQDNDQPATESICQDSERDLAYAIGKAETGNENS